MLKVLAAFLAFSVAKPGYQYEFPRDHYAHPEFRMEWWYWTGNLRDKATGRRLGF
jgi:predicted secreted hydrolase